MSLPLLRALSRAVIAVALVSVAVLIAQPASAHSSAQTSSGGSEEFELTVFPHGAAEAHFTDSWGNRRSGGRSHEGTDIISPRGTEVLAAADGVVTEMGEGGLSGYFIRISHGGGWITSYLHLNNDTLGTDDGNGGTWSAFYPTLIEGDEVLAGQVIGYVGDSGNAEGTVPHTHFELKHNDDKKNPFAYLKDALARTVLPRPTGR